MSSHRPRNGWVHAERRDLFSVISVVSEGVNSVFSPLIDPTSPPSIPFTTSSSRPTESTTTSTGSQTQSVSSPQSSSVTSSSSTSSSQGNSISSTDAVAAAVASSSSSESSSTTNTATAAATNTNTLATTPTPTTTSAPITQSVYEITSNGQVSTVTSFVDGPAATSNTSRTATPTGQSFLQNKTLSGVVFALAGLFGVVAILALAIFTVRRRRNKRLLKEAISFDPTAVNEYVAEVEKDGNSARYGSSSSDYHGHNEPEAVYPFGAGQGYGHTDLGVRVPQQPERALSPRGQLRSAPREMLPNFAHGEGIGWAPDPAPFMPTQPATSYNTGDAGANRVLKIANE